MLLLIDCLINLLLGILLLLFPFGIIELLGLPKSNTYFYSSILGAIILGIGLALLLELVGYSKNTRGLGLGGAILINLTGAIVLFYWLLFGSLTIPLKGQIILWIVVIIVFFIGITELIASLGTMKNKFGKFL